MNDRRSRAFTEAALSTIKTILDDSESPADFLAGVDALLTDTSSLLELPTDLGPAEAMAPASSTSGVDVDNGPAVYEYLGAQDPSNASDPRLWTYLAFWTYRDYMEARWPLDASKNWKGRVEDRWLIRSASRGSLIRHGIARLWWVSHLTYDATCAFPLSAARRDPFAYTREAFKNEDRIIGLFDREAGSIRSLARAVLATTSADGSPLTDKTIRALMKEVTLVYGYRDLEAMSDEELAALVAGLVPAR